MPWSDENLLLLKQTKLKKLFQRSSGSEPFTERPKLKFTIVLLKVFVGLFLICQNVDPTLANSLHNVANFQCCKWPNIEKIKPSGHTASKYQTISCLDQVQAHGQSSKNRRLLLCFCPTMKYQLTHFQGARLIKFDHHCSKACLDQIHFDTLKLAVIIQAALNQSQV